MNEKLFKQQAEAIVAEARPFATAAAQGFAKTANARAKKDGMNVAFFGLCGSLTFQNCATTIALESFEPGSQGGIDFLEEMFDNAKRDALERWQKPDLKAAMNPRIN